MVERQQTEEHPHDQEWTKATGLSRRQFLKASAAAGIAPLVVPNSVFGADAPSNRLNLALIGAGNQSRVDLPAVLRFDDVQVVAVCDVNRGSHGYARPEHFLGREPVRDTVNAYYAKKTGAGTYRGCDVYSDFREVLARDDIDAVMVILPDHWHALVTVLACRAGKDVYCQKPLSLTVHDGQQMVQAVRKHQRILQTGSQYRSNAVVRRVAELVRNGRIGKVQRAIAIVNDSGPGPAPAGSRCRSRRALTTIFGSAPLRSPVSHRPLPVPFPVPPGLLGRTSDQHRRTTRTTSCSGCWARTAPARSSSRTWAPSGRRRATCTPPP